MTHTRSLPGHDASRHIPGRAMALGNRPFAPARHPAAPTPRRSDAPRQAIAPTASSFAIRAPRTGDSRQPRSPIWALQRTLSPTGSGVCACQNVANRRMPRGGRILSKTVRGARREVAPRRRHMPPHRRRRALLLFLRRCGSAPRLSRASVAWLGRYISRDLSPRGLDSSSPRTTHPPRMTTWIQCPGDAWGSNRGRASHPGRTDGRQVQPLQVARRARHLPVLSLAGVTHRREVSPSPLSILHSPLSPAPPRLDTQTCLGALLGSAIDARSYNVALLYAD